MTRISPLLTGLMLLNLEDGRKIDLGQFYAAPHYTGDIRCDLHPRWSLDGGPSASTLSTDRHAKSTWPTYPILSPKNSSFIVSPAPRLSNSSLTAIIFKETRFTGFTR